MLLSTVPNPYKSGAPTRIVKFRKDSGQVFAIDAETLHRFPDLLASFDRLHPTLIRVCDAFSVVMAMFAVMSAYLIAWWLFIPGILSALLLAGASRWIAGGFARRAAKRSNRAFVQLHSLGLVWLLPS